jgi:predicted 3-demethylubiquinone-9 3-methyltransferase (glyoxalase superfamily)
VQKIIPFLWFDNQAEEAVKLYISIFLNSKISNTARYGKSGSDVSSMQEGTVMTVNFSLNGQEFIALNGGPVFKFSPAISFFVNCDSNAEITKIWKKLLVGGTVLMELDKYPHSEKFGWLQDKFGISWQLNLGHKDQKITPFLMFTKREPKKAEEAIQFYISQFKNSNIIKMDHNDPNNKELKGTIKFATFSLQGLEFNAIDSDIDHQFTFTPAISFLVNCKNQSEIDTLWKSLSEGGSTEQCGWLKDKFGISWQIVPESLNKLLFDEDPKKMERKMAAMLKMTKIEIKVLEQIS